MKILYFSDNYGRMVSGVKWGIFRCLRDFGHEVEWQDITYDGDYILEKSKEYKQIWFASSLPYDFHFTGDTSWKSKTVLFGFSDPTQFNESRLDFCIVYITSNYDIYTKYKDSKKIIYMPPSCDVEFHRKMNIEKTIDVLFYGIGNHQAMIPIDYRQEVIRMLKQHFNVHVFGFCWGEDIGAENVLIGESFLERINQARLGIDISQDCCPMARRIFEMGACGVPVLARSSEQLRRLLVPNYDYIEWTDEIDLINKIGMLLNDNKKLEFLSKNIYSCVRQKHDIKNRVQNILSQIPNI